MGTGRDLLAARQDGSEFPVEVGLNSTATSLGDIVIATVVDITERKRTSHEENVHERMQERVQACQQLGMPAAVLRQDGQVVLTNPLFVKLHSQFVFNDDRIEVADPTANESFRRELASLDRRNHDKIVYSNPVLAADGHTRLIFHLLPIEGTFGSTLGILIVTTLNALEVPLPKLVERLFAHARPRRHSKPAQHRCLHVYRKGRG
jgi:hypothetical protein